MKTILSLAAALLLAGCNKAIDALEQPSNNNSSNSGPAAGIVAYTIPAGAHYCEQNRLRAVDLSEQNFIVRFDSSAIYQTIDGSNQYDINKLWGFSDNNGTDHHQYSARFGWRWSDGALRLFGYVYNAGVMTEKELGTVALGADAHCGIRVKGSQYFFSLNGRTDSMPRAATTASGKGYQLYPYFGGDETAPHQVTIWIREQ